MSGKVIDLEERRRARELEDELEGFEGEAGDWDDIGPTYTAEECREGLEAVVATLLGEQLGSVDLHVGLDDHGLHLDVARVDIGPLGKGTIQGPEEVAKALRIMADAIDPPTTKRPRKR